MRSGVAVALIALLSVAGGCGLPPDELLVHRFQKNKQVFERLHGMIIGDAKAVTLVACDSYVLRTGSELKHQESAAFSRDRWDLYCSVMQGIGVGQISVDDGEVSLLAGSQGAVLTGAGKGFVRMNARPKDPPFCQLAASLDGLERTLPEGARCHRALGDDWYLFVGR